MAKPAIIITGADLAIEAMALLSGFNLIFAGKKPLEADLISLCQRHDPIAIIVRYGRITPAIIAAAPSLAVISKHGSGIDTIDVEAARKRGIAVRAAVGANATAVAEHALALMLACAKSIVPLNARMLDGHWDKATHKSMELGGRVLGLVGLGAIGGRMAKYGLALGMRVIAHDPFAKTAPSCIALMPLEKVLAEADVLSLHCPLTEANTHMINTTTIAQMRDGAILINTARGGLVEEAALVKALKSGKLRAAGLDSFAVEPLENAERFHGLPNLVLSPHIGGVSVESYIGMGVGAASNVLDALKQLKRVAS